MNDITHWISGTHKTSSYSNTTRTLLVKESINYERYNPLDFWDAQNELLF